MTKEEKILKAFWCIMKDEKSTHYFYNNGDVDVYQKNVKPQIDIASFREEGKYV